MTAFSSTSPRALGILVSATNAQPFGLPFISFIGCTNGMSATASNISPKSRAKYEDMYGADAVIIKP